MPMIEPSIPAVLRERASLQPNDTAFTFIDYEQDWAGVAESLTWSQVYRRALNVAHELRLCGSTGDRAVILAPQGLDYIVAFLGALQAGLIAVPLSVPSVGAHDDRVKSVLADTSPSVILTTSSVVGNVIEYAQPRPGEFGPSVIEIDLLELDSRRGSGPGAAVARVPRICNTLPGRHVSRPGSWSRTATFRPISNRRCPTTFPTTGRWPRQTPLSCRGCRSITTWV